MKKIIILILAFFYISTSVGLTVHVHYCMTKLVGWDIGFKTSKTCGKCGMDESAEKGNDCCRDELTVLANTGDQKISGELLPELTAQPMALPLSLHQIPAGDFPNLRQDNLISRALLRVDAVPVYIRNCVFRI